jgi:hypothetical protein
MVLRHAAAGSTVFLNRATLGTISMSKSGQQLLSRRCGSQSVLPQTQTGKQGGSMPQEAVFNAERRGRIQAEDRSAR